jgi:hypothetical protein
MIIDPLDLELQDARLEFAKKQREVSEWRIIMDRLFKQKSVYGRKYHRLCVPPE